MIYKLNKSYDTKTERTQRVLDVAEMFGLGLDDKRFVVLDDFEVDIRQGDIVYITGQSGSGKSTILRELQKQMAEQGLKISDIRNVVLDNTKPIINQVYPDDHNMTRTLELFSFVGLSDANLFLRKPCELSDGQLYRFYLAKMIEAEADVWIADEFLALLDRVTAKVIAFNIQKIARKVGVTLIVATTHNDMVQDLCPSVLIQKRYQDKIETTRGE